MKLALQQRESEMLREKAEHKTEITAAAIAAAAQVLEGELDERDKAMEVTVAESARLRRSLEAERAKEVELEMKLQVLVPFFDLQLVGGAVVSAVVVYGTVASAVPAPLRGRRGSG
jgi:hypothetical protein